MSTMSTVMNANSTAAFVPAVSNTGSTATKSRTIRVILLRHGEREDETEDYDKRQHTRQERIDPALTAFGHRQAMHAWEKILACLSAGNDKPIFVACSPLRRCIGTAMMVAAAVDSNRDRNNAGSCSVKFALPSDTPSHDSTTPATIPILIMNGLGDCAAQMQSMGGIGKVIKGGWLQCGASPANDVASSSRDKSKGKDESEGWTLANDFFSTTKLPPKAIDTTRSTPLERCLQSICTTAVEVQANEEQKKQQQQKISKMAPLVDMECSLMNGNRNSSEGEGKGKRKDEEEGKLPASNEKKPNDTLPSSPPPSQTFNKLQFWRESQYHYWEQIPPEHLIPMTNAQTLQEHAIASPGDDNSNNPSLITKQIPPLLLPLPMPKNAPSQREGCADALARAVLQTHRAGLDTCVLVTHREAIRWIENHWVKQQHHDDEPPSSNNNAAVSGGGGDGHRRLRRHSRRHGRGDTSATRMYCCVAIYKVTVDSTREDESLSQMLSWESQGVMPYQLLQPNKMQF